MVKLLSFILERGGISAMVNGDGKTGSKNGAAAVCCAAGCVVSVARVSSAYDTIIDQDLYFSMHPTTQEIHHNFAQNFGSVCTVCTCCAAGGAVFCTMPYTRESSTYDTKIDQDLYFSMHPTTQEMNHNFARNFGSVCIVCTCYAVDGAVCCTGISTVATALNKGKDSSSSTRLNEWESGRRSRKCGSLFEPMVVGASVSSSSLVFSSLLSNTFFSSSYHTKRQSAFFNAFHATENAQNKR